MFSMENGWVFHLSLRPSPRKIPYSSPSFDPSVWTSKEASLWKCLLHNGLSGKFLGVCVFFTNKMKQIVILKDSASVLIDFLKFCFSGSVSLRPSTFPQRVSAPAPDILHLWIDFLNQDLKDAGCWVDGDYPSPPFSRTELGILDGSCC